MIKKTPITPLLITATCAAALIWGLFNHSNSKKSLILHNHITEESLCKRETYQGKSYIVCRINPKTAALRLFLNDADGKPYKGFANIAKMLKQNGKRLSFAMNAGMYHPDFTAVGLYIENGRILQKVSITDGVGNFFMKPNGIFYLENGKAGILDTETYVKSNLKPNYATQSGPMLVIQNQIHPRFIVNSPFLEYRNGVGVTTTGDVIFAISEQKVNFNELAHFFRDQQKTPNALFFDGSISSLYAPNLHRYDWWHALGPIIGVVSDAK